MSTIVYQKLVSCQTTTTLKLKVTSTIDLGFLQSIPKKQPSYVHPSDIKPSFSTRLSENSLQLCTENLGSETGSDMIRIDDTPTFMSNKKKAKPTRQIQSNKTKNFPPPLTTMSLLQVRRRSEGGRLIVEAVEATYLQAERRDGRLRLCYSRNEDGNDDVMEKDIEKFERMRRCSDNNGNQALCSRDWKHAALWVASS